MIQILDGRGEQLENSSESDYVIGPLNEDEELVLICYVWGGIYQKKITQKTRVVYSSFATQCFTSHLYLSLLREI